MPDKPDHPSPPPQGNGGLPSEPSATHPPTIPDYQLLRRIGKGAFGEVWLARNVFGAFRAIKVIRRTAFADETHYNCELAGVRRFEPISRSHDGLVDILHVGVNQTEGFFFYAMELADAAEPRRDGEASPADASQPAPILHPPSSTFAPEDYTPLTLSQRLRTDGRLPVAECLRVGVALTDALEFLHQQNLIHRDIKPSNIIFVRGVPKLADVGTVTHVDEAKTMVGTEGFQAPEGPGKPQADLYSLGKVLYEISSGKDRQRFPEPLTMLADLPERAKLQEFNAVVEKACQPEPTRRYPSTTELRADLLLLQAGRSVRRQWLLQRRFKQTLWTAAAAAALVAVFLIAQSFRLREAERGRTLLELEQAIRPPHTAGWSDKAWQIASNAAAKFGFDTNLQSQAAASLAGLDAKPIFQTNGIGGSSVAFSPDGKYVLYGALDDGSTNSGKAHLLDLTTTNLTAFPVPGEGPVAFLPDGTPVQFSADTSNRLALWHVGQTFLSAGSGDFPVARTNTGLESPVNRQAGKPALRSPPTALRFFPLPNSETIRELESFAITPDASFVAASGTTTTGQPFLAAWNGTSGELLFPVAASRQNAANLSPEELRRSTETPLREASLLAAPATALAFTPDGSLLAAGDDSGDVKVWRVPDGSRLQTIKPGRLPILGLAFCRDYIRDPLHPAPETQWLLAIGDEGGGVSIWEAPSQRLRRPCQGGQYYRNQFAFSPDGTLLVSGGRFPTLVWDTATGHTVARLDTGDHMTGLAISGDGSKFTTTVQYPGLPAVVEVAALENGRGIQTLRGLSTPVARICFSHDAGWLAAVSQDWQVGIWNVTNSHLLRVFNLPRGTFTADNAALAFSPDNSQFAYMAGTHAMLIDMASGTCAQQWALPIGRVEELMFDPAGHIYAAHFEPADVTAKELSRPRTFRIRELLPEGMTANLFEMSEFNWDVRRASWTPNASSILVEGTNVKDGSTNRLLRAFSLTGRTNLWTLPQRFKPGDGGTFSLDAVGSLVLSASGFTKLGALDYYLLDTATGMTNRRSLRSQAALNSAAKLQAQAASSGALSLHTLEDDSLLAVIQSGETKLTGSIPTFSRDGRLLAWGNEDGTVSVCELPQMQRLLGAIGLGWPPQKH
jgi:WD40 repeat protein